MCHHSPVLARALLAAFLYGVFGGGCAPAPPGPTTTGVTVSLMTLAAGPGGLQPSDIDSLYNIGPLRAAGLTGAGETILFPEVDDLPTMADLDAFAARHHLPAFDLTVRRDAGWGEPMNRGRPGGEVTMDLEIAHALAPGARLIAYIGGAARMTQLIAVMDALVSEHAGTIISDSLGSCELALSQSEVESERVLGERAAELGLTNFAASGDWGAYPCGDQAAAVLIPSSLPTVTAVGGTTVFLSTAGGRYSEAAWTNPISGRSATGGGVSCCFGRPAWQTGPGTDNADSNGRRQVPDVAAVADANTGVALVIGGRDVQGGGTSAGAPIWAALTALINEGMRRQGLRRVGPANPALYAIGAQPALGAFHDITLGNNYKHHAGPGWDYTTGWGTPDAAALARAWEGHIRRGGA